MISLDLGIFRIPHTSPRLNTLDDILSGWDAQVIQCVSNLLAVWGCETFYQVLGFIYGENWRIGVFVSPFFFCLQFLALDCERWSRPISGWASVLFFLAFERIPVVLSHFEESCDSQVLPIASRKRELLGPQK